MKTIRINGVEQDLPAGAIIFDEYIKELNQGLNAERRVISAIRIDGREISDMDEGALKGREIAELGQIEVDTASPADLAYETLNTLDQYLDRLVSSIERAATHYKGKSLVTGDAYFAKAIDGLDLFVQTIGGVKLALRVGLQPKLALTEAQLVSIMNDLLDAKRQNNYVFMAELLEKDLIENLGEWRTEVFPFFRNWKTS